jgi:penicillin-binding protein 1A
MIAKIVKFFTVLGLIGVIVLVGSFLYLYQQTELDADKLINYSPNTSSEILDRHGKRLAYIFKGRHRLYATYDEIPPYLIEALVAIEDTKFFEHSGVNPDAILRAIVRDIRARKFVEGGSTITQQLIKITLLNSKKKLERKIQEAILALKIENRLTKEQILERYLNEIPYGNNYYGVKTAAQGYFHKELRELSLKESVILVGLPNAPSFYNPLRHYKRSLNRANAILFRMKSIGWITEQEYIKASKEAPKVYRTTLTQNVAPYIVDELLRRFKGRFGDIRTGGYKIYTTIDLGMQKIAREAVDTNFRRVAKRYGDDTNKTKLNGSMVAVENNTGDILALVGGVDYRKSQFNRVTMTKRQPGSAFKPFVYQTALDMGYNPATKLTDLSRTFKYMLNGREKIWAPRNYERDYKGFIPLREALVHSRNLATVNLVFDIGVEVIRKRLALLDVPNIPKDLSIALGNLGLSPLKMAQIYTAFSNKGHIIEPRLVSKMISKEGAVLFETKPKEIANFTKPEQAYLMTDILKDVVKRGTGRNAQVKGLELAGKTGTTNRGVDAWFCGYSPTVTTIVWYGRDNNRPIGKGATGGSVAAPAFSYFYRELLKLYPNTPRNFEKPKDVFMGEGDSHKELYTAISPLPAGNKNSPKEMFKGISSDTNTTIESDHKSDEDMEVIRIDDEPVITEKISPEQKKEEIDPLHLKPVKPKPVGDGDDGEAMF